MSNILMNLFCIETDIPGSWETMKDDEIYKSIPLNSNDDEYKNVARAVMATSQNCFITIVKVWNLICMLPMMTCNSKLS